MPPMQVFHSGTKQDASGQVVSAGGRVLAVTALADDQQEAQRLAYQVNDSLILHDFHSFSRPPLSSIRSHGRHLLCLREA